MRGSKSKALRRAATQIIQHGTTFHVLKSGGTQALTTPHRYLYQFLKGKNANLGFTTQEGVCHKTT